MHRTGIKIIGNNYFICPLYINFLLMVYLKTVSMAHALRRRMADLENVRSQATVVSLSLHPIICQGLWKNFSYGNRSPGRHLTFWRRNYFLNFSTSCI